MCASQTRKKVNT